MDDLISRQAVKELAHNQVCEKYCGAALKGHRDFYIKLADRIIDLLPSAQPEIIRCKDCRFAILTYDGDCKYCQYLEGEFGLTDAVYFDGNDYCSHAERRTDD
jgi:hypothetical protein